MTDALVDLNHWMGGDLAVGPTGGLGVVADSVRGQQRVLRRLCTNPGTYLQQPEYGAGLAQFIGTTATVAEVSAVIVGQLALEAAVAQSAPPIVDVVLSNTVMSVSIQYADASSGAPVLLAFSVDSAGA